MQIPGSAKHCLVAALLVAVTALILVTPASALEDSLMGVRIGASYRDLVERFGQPAGILFPAGGGMIFQTMPALTPSSAGLPQFAAQPVPTDIPVWVLPARVSFLTETQSQWCYDLRHTRGVALAIVLSGEGADAVVTDVVVAGFPENLANKPVPVRTERGITLQSTFSELLQTYGYPPLIEIYVPSGAARAGGGAAPGGAMRAGARGGGGGGGARGGGGGARSGGRGGMGMRGGRGRADAGPSAKTILTAQAPPFELVLTGGMRGGGRSGGGTGARGGGMGGRGGGGGARGGGAAGGGARRALPPLGAQAGPGAADQLTASAVVNYQSIALSRNCIITYEGIAFTLHDMRVMRIHVSE